MTEITKFLDSLTPRQFEQLLYEAEKRGLVSHRVAVDVVDVDKPKQEPVKRRKGNETHRNTQRSV